MPPLAIGLGVAAAGSIGGAAIGAGAAKDSAEQQLQGTRESIAAQKEAALRSEALLREFNGQSRNDLQPLINAQSGALTQLSGFADANNPIYQQQREASTKAIQQQLAAQGLLRSRSQGDQLSQLELGLNQQRLGVSQGLASLGGMQQLSSQNANVGGALAGIQQNLGQQIGSAFQQQGQIRGQSTIQQANAWQGGLAGLGNAVQSGLGMINPQQQMSPQQFLAQFGIGGGGMR